MRNASRHKKRKQYYKLRRNRAWIPLVMFVIVSAAVSFMGLLLLEAFGAYSINSQLSGMYKSVKSMTDLYDRGVKIEDGDPIDILEKQGYRFILLDKKDNVLRQNTEDTRSEESGLIPIGRLNDMFFKDENDNGIKVSFDGVEGDMVLVMAYRDSERPFLFPDDDAVGLSIPSIIKASRNNTLFVGGDPEKLNNSDQTKMSEREIALSVGTIDMPIWVEVPLRGGEQRLMVRLAVTAQMADVAFLAIIIIAMAVMLALIFLVMLINAINAIINQKRINKMFFRDIATKGRNFMWFLIKGEQLLRSRRTARTPYAVVDLTFVRYRNFCVCHSIEEGEQLLAAVGEIIGEGIEKKKELWAHCSDGHFALLLKCPDEEKLNERLGQLIFRLEKADERHSFAFQAGIYPIAAVEEITKIFPRRSDVDLERDYNNAVTARAKLEGSDDSGVVSFDEKLIEEQRWEDTVRERQQAALDNEEFLVYYQPKYDPTTDRLRGAEALIRWQSPEFGFVTPYRFIPIFEKNGFITEIDHYMLEHVARDQRRWLDQGLRCVPVSVNVSRAHFIESDLAEQIRDIVDREGTPREYIEIELTESAFFDDKKAMIDTILKLKEYGFAVSMDDFGSGYSSLNSLKDMPLDVLKLDAEFFRGEEAGSDRAGIVVSEAIRLARSLNMRTVAEGVEVREQVEFLAEQGCDMIQGYYYAKPMPGSEYEERMRGGVAEVEKSE